MTALAPPEARDERARELREALAYLRPDTANKAGLLLNAEKARAAVAVVVADLDALRRKVAEAEASDAESLAMYRRARDRAEAATAERDALAEMAGLIAGTWAKALAAVWACPIGIPPESWRFCSAGYCLACLQGRIAFVEARTREAKASLAAATARATEAEERLANVIVEIDFAEMDERDSTATAGTRKIRLADIASAARGTPVGSPFPARSLSPADPSQSAEGAGQPKEPTP